MFKMMIKRTPPTERVEKLRALYLAGPVMQENLSYCRTRRQRLLYAKGYAESGFADTARLRRAYAEAYVLKNMRPVINAGEMIVGLPDFTPLTPEETAENAEYEEKMVGAPVARNHGGHMTLDFEKLLKIGVDGLLREVQERRAALDMLDASSVSRDEFYEACEIELSALLELEEHYAAYAEARGLYELAAMLRRVPRGPAHSFHEALQSMHFYRFCLWDLYYYGRIDQYLYPYLKADLDSGVLSEDDAQELLDCFFLLPTAYITPNSSNVVLVGGCSPEGVPVENRLTWMSLRAIEHVRLASCKVGLAVTDATSDGLLRYAAELNARGFTHPALFNDALITEAFRKAGFPEDVSRNYCNTGCVEMTPCAMSGMWVVSPYHNLAAMFLNTLRDNPEVSSLDGFLDAYSHCLRQEIIRQNNRLNRWQMERSRSGCESMRAACLVHDCLETGRALDEGGARYNHTQPNFLGLANVVDSIAALDRLCFLEKTYTPAEIYEILQNDYRDAEALRLSIVNTFPHFGCGEEQTDALAVRLTEMIAENCRGIANFHGAPLLPGAFSYLEHERHGSRTMATLDGRHAGEPLASGSGAVQGFETKGPTAAILSETAWDHSLFLGGVAVNIRFGDDIARPEKLDLLTALIRTFLARGGFQLQINAVSGKTLCDAREHPENYPDLVVRVGGFSAYFTKLSPAMQGEIIRRNEHTL